MLERFARGVTPGQEQIEFIDTLQKDTLASIAGELFPRQRAGGQRFHLGRLRKKARTPPD